MINYANGKDDKIEYIANRALKNKDDLLKLFEGILSKDDKIRYDSFKILNFLSEKNPEILYSRWDLFKSLMYRDNDYLKLIAVKILANLTSVDKENKFQIIFEKYYGLLNESVIVAGHLAASSGKIAKAKPEFRLKITNILLNIDKSKQKHKDLVKAYVIDAFDLYFKESENKNEILQFIRNNLNCNSPKTRKKAKDFLRKWA
jgi:hypothetical protein